MQFSDKRRTELSTENFGLIVKSPVPQSHPADSKYIAFRWDAIYRAGAKDIALTSAAIK